MIPLNEETHMNKETYTVQFTRTYSIEVEAENLDDAVDTACDTDLSEFSFDTECDLWSVID